MTARDLEMIRPWLDPEQRPADIGWKPARSLLRKGWLAHEFDNFYVLTDHGKTEAEKLIGRPL